jgi:hypothetical protein
LVDASDAGGRTSRGEALACDWVAALADALLLQLALAFGGSFFCGGALLVGLAGSSLLLRVSID